MDKNTWIILAIGWAFSAVWGLFTDLDTGLEMAVATAVAVAIDRTHKWVKVRRERLKSG